MYLKHSVATRAFNVDIKKFKHHRNLAAIRTTLKRIMNRTILPNSIVSAIALIGFTGLTVTYC